MSVRVYVCWGWGWGGGVAVGSRGRGRADLLSHPFVHFEDVLMLCEDVLGIDYYFVSPPPLPHLLFFFFKQ